MQVVGTWIFTVKFSQLFCGVEMLIIKHKRTHRNSKYVIQTLLILIQISELKYVIFVAQKTFICRIFYLSNASDLSFVFFSLLPFIFFSFPSSPIFPLPSSPFLPVVLGIEPSGTLLLNYSTNPFLKLLNYETVSLSCPCWT